MQNSATIKIDTREELSKAAGTAAGRTSTGTDGGYRAGGSQLAVLKVRPVFFLDKRRIPSLFQRRRAGQLQPPMMQGHAQVIDLRGADLHYLFTVPENANHKGLNLPELQILGS